MVHRRSPDRRGWSLVDGCSGNPPSGVLGSLVLVIGVVPSELLSGFEVVVFVDSLESIASQTPSPSESGGRS